MEKQQYDFRVALPSDVAALEGLVNRAYRPEPGRAGWTHEAHLVSGVRTTAGQIEALMAPLDSALLVGLHAGSIVACVHVEKHDATSYIGLLAVDPALQAKGIGTRMLDEAERYATRIFGAEKHAITVVSHREELVSFYLRRGYQLTGRTVDFPAYAGNPKQPGLELVELAKPVPRVHEPGIASASLNT